MEQLPDFEKVAFPDSPPLAPALAFPRVSPSGLPLLTRLLQLDPARRPSAAEALADEWFCRRPLAIDPSELPLPLRPLPAGAGGGKGNGPDSEEEEED